MCGLDFRVLNFGLAVEGLGFVGADSLGLRLRV